MGLDEIARGTRIRLPEPPRLEIDQGRTARDDVKSRCAIEYRTEGAFALGFELGGAMWQAKNAEIPSPVLS